MNKMKTRYRLTRRGIRGDKFYCVDKTTGKRTSLGTTNEDEARQIVEAKNNSERHSISAAGLSPVMCLACLFRTTNSRAGTAISA
jgi:hypothetical protein